jgi:hypothetical protein
VNRAITALRRLQEWTADLLVSSTGITIHRRERPLWRAATSLQDLCDLTAGWLEGDIRSQPGYYGPVDVDEDEAPGITGALVALNQAGFLTRDSQAGYAVDDGYEWTQLAAVTGYAGEQTVAHLRSRLAGTGYGIRAVKARDHDEPFDWAGVPVTCAQDEPFTVFGCRLSRLEIMLELEGAGIEAVDAVTEALQVTIWDPQPGPNQLWATLQAAAQTPAPPITLLVEEGAPVLGPRRVDATHRAALEEVLRQGREHGVWLGMEAESGLSSDGER